MHLLDYLVSLMSLTLDIISVMFYSVNSFLDIRSVIIMVQLTLRVPGETLAKVRVLAAVHDQSQNEFIIQTLADAVARWESEHGKLPVLPQSSD